MTIRIFIQYHNRLCLLSLVPVLFLSVFFIQAEAFGAQRAKWKGTVEMENGIEVMKNPLSFNPAVWKNEKVYAIEEDDSGFQVVKRYKVIWD